MAFVVSDNQSRTFLYSVFVSKLLGENYAAVLSNFDGHARHRHTRCITANERFSQKSRSNVKCACEWLQVLLNVFDVACASPIP